jgi:hypothetical protein
MITIERSRNNICILVTGGSQLKKSAGGLRSTGRWACLCKTRAVLDVNWHPWSSALLTKSQSSCWPSKDSIRLSIKNISMESYHSVTSHQTSQSELSLLDDRPMRWVHNLSTMAGWGAVATINHPWQARAHWGKQSLKQALWSSQQQGSQKNIGQKWSGRHPNLH